MVLSLTRITRIDPFDVVALIPVEEIVRIDATARRFLRNGKTERTRGIGVRKATGARNSDLLAQFLAESVAIAGLGSVLGTILGIFVAAMVAAIMRAKTIARVHAGFSISTLIVVVAVGAPMIVGIAFGTYPALRAARLSPIEAIRHE